MKKTSCVATASVAFVCTLAGSALADHDVAAAAEAIPASKEALEIGLSAGYAQGFGSIEGGRPIARYADGGYALEGSLGYRADPSFSMAFTGQYSRYEQDGFTPYGTTVRGFAWGIDTVVHFLPFDRIDPILVVGSGYRLFWVSSPGRQFFAHGFELVKLQVGFEVRESRQFSIGPVVGGSMNLFLWRTPRGFEGSDVIDDRRVSTFVYAGVVGRFDLGGMQVVRVTENVAQR